MKIKLLPRSAMVGLLVTAVWSTMFSATFNKDVSADVAVENQPDVTENQPDVTFYAHAGLIDGFLEREAEDSANVVAGDAEIDSCRACSGGHMVRWLGNGFDNYLKFNDIQVPSAGSYQLTIYYITDEARSLSIRANGVYVDYLSNLNSGSRYAIASVDMTVDLMAGRNTIKLYNPDDWAPDIDRITVRSAPQLQSPFSSSLIEIAPLELDVEAEDSANAVAGDAEIDDCRICSGTHMVRWLGNGFDNYLKFNDIQVPNAGSYQLTIYYITDEARSLSIRANGVYVDYLSNLNSGSRYAIASVDVTLDLMAGRNTIKLYNPDDWAPDIDRITVRSLPLPWQGLGVEAEDSANVVAGDAEIDSCRACSGGHMVRWLGNGFDNYLKFNDIQVPSAGSYQLTIYYITDEARSLSIRANGVYVDYLSNLNSGDRYAIASVDVTLDLNTGRNTIKLYNTDDWAPDIDRITVRSLPRQQLSLIEVSQLELDVTHKNSHENYYTWYRVALDSSPSSDVTLTITPSDTNVRIDTDMASAGDQSTLTFTPQNWTVPQIVKVHKNDKSVYSQLPSELTVTPGDGQVSLDWSSPTGSPPTGYSVQYRRLPLQESANGGTTWTDVPHSDTSTSTTVDGLTNGLDYEVRVAAVRDSSTGSYTKPVRSTPSIWRGFELGQNALPPMGWVSWNAFHLDVDDEKIRGIADAMVSDGYRDVGYEYVNIDDGWWLQRSESSGALVVKTDRFPSAAQSDSALVELSHSFSSRDATYAALAPATLTLRVTDERTTFKPFVEYIHSLGLKAGIYSDIGRNSCGQYYDADDPNQPLGNRAEREIGTYGNVYQDISLFFEDWGFDYLKLDACGVVNYSPSSWIVRGGTARSLGPFITKGGTSSAYQVKTTRRLYSVVRDAMIANNPDDDFALSITTWGDGDVQHWGAEVGNSWRTTADIHDSWSSMISIYLQTVNRALYAGPHHWNDPDMMYIGVGDFDGSHLRNARTHFSLWAMMNAPLLIGFDLREEIDPGISRILKNEEVIALNQDPGGHQAVRMNSSSREFALPSEADILVKTLSEGPGVKAVALVNRSMDPTRMTVTREHLRFADDTSATVRDLWAGTDLADLQSDASGYTVAVAPHGTRVLVFRGTHRLTDARYVSELPGIVHIAENGYGEARADRGFGRGSTSWGGELSLDGTTYDYGIGAHADSHIQVRLHGEFQRFTATVGVDDSAGAGRGSVTFTVYGDGMLLDETDERNSGDTPRDIDVDVTGVDVLELVADGGANIDFDHADWADAILHVLAPPTAPTDLMAHAVGLHQIDLTWSEPSGGGVSGYKIEVSSDGQKWEVLEADTGDAETAWAHLDLPASSTRHYRVSAINAAGTGEPSGAVSATTPPVVGVGFSALTADVDEGSTVRVSVLLSQAPEREVVVPLVAAGTDGGSAEDFTVPVSVTFGRGDTEASFVFAAVDDAVDDDREAVTIRFGRLPEGVFQNYGTGYRKSVIFIGDDDAPEVTVGFSALTADVDEGSTVRVSVLLSQAPEREVVVPLVAAGTGGGSAEDFSGVPASVTFSPRDTEASFVFAAVDDDVDDDGEGVTLRFASLPEGVSAGDAGEAVVSIGDDDVPAVDVSFAEAVLDVDEGSDVEVAVSLSQAPERTVVVPIAATVGGGADSGDHSAVPESVVFGPDDTEASFVFAAVDDDVDDDGESVTLSFGELPEGVTARTPAEALVALGDDDVVVSFSVGEYSVEEGSTVRVVVSLSEAPRRELVVPIDWRFNGATVQRTRRTDYFFGADFFGLVGSVSFGPDDTEASFVLTAVDDNIGDADESVTLSLVRLPKGVVYGSVVEAVVSIVDSGVVWSGSVTVGRDDNSGNAVLGWSSFGAFGAVDPRNFVLDDEFGQVNFVAFLPSSDTLYFGKLYRWLQVSLI